MIKSYDRRLLQPTVEAASALLEDISHIRAIADHGSPPRGEVRRLAAPIRRLLIDRDLTKVASPRIGRVELEAKDYSKLLKEGQKRGLEIFVGGGARLYNDFLGQLSLFRQPNFIDKNKNDETANAIRDISSMNYPVNLRLDPYLNGQVMFFRGTALNRRDVIKYMANKASGVHSENANGAKDIALAKLRNTFVISHNGEAFSVQPSESIESKVDIVPTEYSALSSEFDPVLVQLLAIATEIADSTDVHRLEAFIGEELGRLGGKGPSAP